MLAIKVMHASDKDKAGVMEYDGLSSASCREISVGVYMLITETMSRACYPILCIIQPMHADGSRSF